VADPLVLRLRAPYLACCVVVMASGMPLVRRLGRLMGALLFALYVEYLRARLALWQ
jgi:hypothetical protein